MRWTSTHSRPYFGELTKAPFFFSPRSQCVRDRFWKHEWLAPDCNANRFACRYIGGVSAIVAKHLATVHVSSPCSHPGEPVAITFGSQTMNRTGRRPTLPEPPFPFELIDLTNTSGVFFLCDENNRRLRTLHVIFFAYMLACMLQAVPPQIASGQPERT